MNSRNPFWAVLLWSLLSYLPILLIALLPNAWYWHVLRIFAGLFLVGLIFFFASRRFELHYGNTYSGFLMNMVFLGIMCFDVPNWVRLVLPLLMALTMHMNVKIMERYWQQLPTTVGVGNGLQNRESDQ